MAFTYFQTFFFFFFLLEEGGLRSICTGKGTAGIRRRVPEPEQSEQKCRRCFPGRWGCEAEPASSPRQATAPARPPGGSIRRGQSRSYLAAREPASPPRPLAEAARPRGGGDAAGPRRPPGWGSGGCGPLAGAASRSGGPRRGSPRVPGPGRPRSSRMRRRPTSGCPGATPRPSPPPFPLLPLPPPLPPRLPRPRSPGCRGSTPAASTTRAEATGRPRLRPAGPARPPAGCAPSRSPGPSARGGRPGPPGRLPRPRRPPSAGPGPPLGARAAASRPRAAAAARGSSSPSRSLAPGAARRRSHVLFFPGPAACRSPPPTSPQSRVPRPPPPAASPSPRLSQRPGRAAGGGAREPPPRPARWASGARARVPSGAGARRARPHSFRVKGLGRGPCRRPAGPPVGKGLLELSLPA